MIGLVYASRSEQARQERWEVERKRREEEHQKWLRKEEERQEEEGKVKMLYSETENWVRSCQIRDYVAAVRLNCQEPIDAGSGLRQWLVWAENHANKIDPLLTRFSDTSLGRKE